MKTNQKSKKIKKINKAAIIITVILLSVVIIFAILEKFQITNFLNQTTKSQTEDNSQLIDNNQATPEQKAAGEEQKESTANTVTNNDLGVTISYIDISTDPIKIRSTISGSISNSGTCTLKLISGESVITKTANTYALPNSSTCEGFDIPKSELNSGKWQISLTVKINDNESNIIDSFNLE